MKRLKALAVVPGAVDERALVQIGWILGLCAVKVLEMKACDATLGIVADPSLRSVSVLFQHDGSFSEFQRERFTDLAVQPIQLWLERKLPERIGPIGAPVVSDMGVMNGTFLPGYRYKYKDFVVEDDSGKDVPQCSMGQFWSPGANVLLHLQDREARRAAKAFEGLGVFVERQTVHPSDSQ